MTKAHEEPRRSPEDIARGKRIQSARREAGFASQASLAAEIGVTPVTLSRYENGWMYPSGAVLARLAEACGVTMFWLTTGREQGDMPASVAPAAGAAE